MGHGKLDITARRCVERAVSAVNTGQLQTSGISICQVDQADLGAGDLLHFTYQMGQQPLEVGLAGEGNR